MAFGQALGCGTVVALGAVTSSSEDRRFFMISPSTTVASIVLEHSECAQIMYKHRIDYCCRGDMSLEQAARERGVDLSALTSQLEQAIAERRGNGADAMREMPTPALIEHIVTKHHSFLRRSLPYVQMLASKVGRVHGDHNPKLRVLDKAVTELSDSLLAHLDDEESKLFPELRSPSAQAESTATSALRSMREEHLEVARLLEAIREATDDYTLPDWACRSYHTLFSELQATEQDIYKHVHLENHVLAPRFEALASGAGAS